jgi:hypothetical protein
MNWDEIGAVGEAASAVAVLITLVYVAIQVRHIKSQALLGSYQHTIDKHAEFISHLVSSESLAEIIIRGRDSYASLEPVERFRFDFIHALCVNVVESWYFQVIQTSPPGPYRQEHLRNIGEFIRMFCDYPGFIQFWPDYSLSYSTEVRELVDKNIGSVQK